MDAGKVAWEGLTQSSGKDEETGIVDDVRVAQVTARFEPGQKIRLTRDIGTAALGRERW